jgi:EmrB/QacA subfamily drug resistance transporter
LPAPAENTILAVDLRGWHHHGQVATAGAPPSAERRLLTVLIAASMGIFAVQLDFFALNLSLPEMARELDTNTTDIQWVISGYMLALGAFLIPGGRVGDLLGRKRMLIIGLAIFGGASLAAGLAPNPTVVIAFRVVQGVGAAILFPVSIAVLSNAYPPEQRMRAIGNAYGLAAVATALGPVVGGALTELVDWRAVLLINVPITAVAIALVVRSVSESRDETAPRDVDLPGLAAVALGIAAVTFAVDRSEDWGWGSPDTLLLLAAGALLLVAFVFRERAAPHPLVDLGLFSNRPYVGITLIGTAANVAFVVTTFSVTLYLQQVEDYSALQAGLIFIAASAPLALSGPLSGRLAERFDVPRTMVVGCAVGTLGLLIISTGAALGPFLIAMLLYGGGYGLGWSLASVGTQAVVAPDRAGQASGVTLAIVIGTAGLFVTIAATVIESVAGGGTGLGTAIEDTVRVLAIASVILASALLLITRGGDRD